MSTAVTAIDLAPSAWHRHLGDLFALGVASGDPSYDGVVLWTRLTRDPLAPDGLGGMPSRAVPVDWEVASDEAMRHVVRRGTTVALPRAAHAVHVEVTGLRPGAEHFYRFRAGTGVSAVGRTVTTPLPGAFGGPLAMGIVSCADWGAGYFTAYRRLAEDQPDLVLHLGDYIYENNRGSVRPHQPDRPCVSLADYRVRHAQARTDPDLQAAHLVAPWSVVWDDHDVQNNYAGLSPAVREPGFAARRAAAYQAYYEHLPVRHGRMYRRVRWGSLATFHLLDTRQYRDNQACGDGVRLCLAAAAPHRTITGARQEAWLERGLAASTSRWDLIVQQVFFAVRDLVPGPAVGYSMDAWDGYAASRERVLDTFVRDRVRNPVVLTGDVHKHFANDVARGPDPEGRPVASELVTTSVSSTGDGRDLPPDVAALLAENPHIKFVNGQRGYIRARLEPGLLTADFRVLPYVSRPGAPVSTRATYVVEDGHPGVVAV